MTLDAEIIWGKVELGPIWSDKVASLKIEGNCCWSFFTEKNLKGNKLTLGEGEYKSATQIRDIYKRAKSATQHRC